LIEDIHFDASHFELVLKNLDVVIIIKVAKKLMELLKTLWLEF